MYNRIGIGLFLAAVGIALTGLPQRAAAACSSYPFSAFFCPTQAFCARVDVLADNSPEQDDPGEVKVEDASPVQLVQTALVTGASADTTVAAGPGVLSVLSNATVSASVGPYGASSRGSSIVMLRIGDLVFSGPEATVETSLNLAVAGTIDVAAQKSSGDASSGGAFEVSGNLCQGSGADIHSFAGGRSYNAQHSGQNPPGQTTGQNRGILFDLPLTGAPVIATTDVFTVPTNEPLQLELWITADSGAVLSGDTSGSASSSVDFGHTLGFPDSGPVFALPAGFTANSVEGGIEGNRVPEPGSGWLGLAALTSLGWLARARAGRRAR